MARGHQKEVAQQKNAAKKAAAEKKGTQKGAAEKKLTFTCPICKASMPGYVVMKDHYASKHPKETCPDEAAFAK